MSNRVWYKLLPKGTPSSSSDQMDDVECLKTNTISELRRLVKKENMPTLGNVEARSIEVYENGSEDTVCSPAKLLSACASGGPELPFIIYHPPAPAAGMASAGPSGAQVVGGLPVGKNMRELIKAAGKKTVEPGVLRRAEIRFATRITNALMQQDPESALDIYEDAYRLPKTSTEISLAERNIRLNGGFMGGLLICFEKTVPHVLKIVESEEKDRLTAFRDKLIHPNIIPFKFLSNEHMIMPLHPITLEHFSGLNQDEALLLWQNLEPALAHLHLNNLAHMDVKPNNILVSCQGSFILCDLGSVAQFGNRSPSTNAYIPLDMQEKPSILIARAEVDWWMLAFVFAEKVTGLVTGTSKKEPDTHSLKIMLSQHQNMSLVWQHLKNKILSSVECPYLGLR